jgi:hypothetical protein
MTRSTGRIYEGQDKVRGSIMEVTDGPIGHAVYALQYLTAKDEQKCWTENVGQKRSPKSNTEFSSGGSRDGLT